MDCGCKYVNEICLKKPDILDNFTADAFGALINHNKALRYNVELRTPEAQRDAPNDMEN